LAKSNTGIFNPAGILFPIASIGALRYRHNGSLASWTATLTRWSGAYTWGIGDDLYNQGWGWSESNFGDSCNDGWGGWNGSGWGWRGLGWGWSTSNVQGWAGSIHSSATYTLPNGATWSCDGGSNVLLPTSDWDSSFPAQITVRRVPLNGGNV
jgi:hypothetical protein